MTKTEDTQNERRYTYAHLEAAMRLERTYIAWSLMLSGHSTRDIMRWTQVSRQTVERLKKI